jgi:hypothetical protein
MWKEAVVAEFEELGETKKDLKTMDIWTEIRTRNLPSISQKPHHLTHLSRYEPWYLVPKCRRVEIFK